MRTRIITFLLIAGMCAGCGEDKPELIPTEGTVIGTDGKPMAQVLVQFTPMDTVNTKVVNSSGVTDSGGKFKLTADTGQPGAVPGKHKVILIDNSLSDDDNTVGKAVQRPINRIPKYYSTVTGSPFEVNVEVGKQHEFRIQK